MANWLQGWNYDSSSSSSGLTPPTEKQVTDAGLLYAAWMFPMTRIGSAVTGWLVRQGAKRIVPPSGLSLVKSALYQTTPAGAVAQMGKGTVYRILAHKMDMYEPLSQSSEGSSKSYQQSGSSGGTINPRVSDPRFNRSLRVKPTNIHGKRGYNIPTHLRCPSGYKLTHMGFGRYACMPN